jgi:hypothetical protein
MIREIVEILAADDFFGESENIDIAKGKYKVSLTFKEAFNNKKRWQKAKR